MVAGKYLFKEQTTADIVLCLIIPDKLKLESQTTSSERFNLQLFCMVAGINFYVIQLLLLTEKW